MRGRNYHPSADGVERITYSIDLRLSREEVKLLGRLARRCNSPIKDVLTAEAKVCLQYLLGKLEEGVDPSELGY